MISSSLISMCLDYQWAIILDRITFSYNNMKHETTKFTPFEMLFGPSIKKLMDSSLNLESEKKEIHKIGKRNYEKMMERIYIQNS